MSLVPRSALIFQGPGFLEDGAVDSVLVSMGFHVQYYQMLQSKTQALNMKLGPRDVIIMRGVGEASFDDLIYTRYLSLSLRELAEQIYKRPLQERPKIIASGRWALGSLWAGFLGTFSESDFEVSWKNHNEIAESNQWIRAKAKGLEGKQFYALKTSKFAVELRGRGLEPILNMYDKYDIGWQSQNLSLYALDPFSMSDASQHSGFGYENLEDLFLGHQYLLSLLKEG